MAGDAVEVELSKFQLDLLSLIAESPRPGLRLRDALEDQYQKAVDHSQVYRQLDKLVELGLVEKQVNGATGRGNLYELTDRGAEVVGLYFGRAWQRINPGLEKYHRSSGGRRPEM